MNSYFFMKKITLLALFIISNISLAQEKLMNTNGIINFEASLPFFEEVKAKNDEVICILIPKTSQLICTATITKFQFKRELMKEHFNSNYMESNKYPKATFKGKIQKFDMKDIFETAKEYQIKGKLEIHGKTKNIVVLAQIKKTDKGIELISSFPLNTDDYNIEIPLIVRSKISKNVNTRIECVLH